MTTFTQPSFLSGDPHPLILSMPAAGRTPLDLYARLASPSQPSFLLESGTSRPGMPTYSFLGSGPVATLVEDSSTVVFPDSDPFNSLRTRLGPAGIARTPDLPPFFGGAVGYLSYDFVRRFEALPARNARDLSIPELQFAFFELVVALDHQHESLRLIYCPSMSRFLGESREKLYREGLDRLAECQARLTRSLEGEKLQAAEPIRFLPDQTRADFLSRIRRCQRYIEAGDIYQANLSHRFHFPLPPGARTGMERLRYEQALYRQLHSINPSPFSGLLHFDDLSLVSCSPERLIRLQGRRADTRPIAGTRPRGASSRSDRELVSDLLASEKERAEHLMLVDLERNDLGRVCEYGSVQVDEFMTIEQYSHVSHIVSNVSGRLRPGATAYDVIKATFPGGTVTGVPKIRCMEVIEELEPVRRGPYTGSFGYIGWNGDLDLNIIIRTLVLTEDQGFLQVGAGIVADSDPAKEYEETLHKAEAFFTSLRQT